jgi:hypothetical protein
MSIGELGAFVCSHLEKNGIRVTLTGGACVSIYSENKYESMDLDFVEEVPVTRRKLKKILGELGFKEENRYFRHPDTDFFLEFPSGPLSVGEEAIGNISVLEFPTGRLRLISPTDCVKDRLAAFYHWDDRQSLEQALLVARDQQIDLLEVQRWSEREGELRKFETFFMTLSK